MVWRVAPGRGDRLPSQEVRRLRLAFGPRRRRHQDRSAVVAACQPHTTVTAAGRTTARYDQSTAEVTRIARRR